MGAFCWGGLAAGVAVVLGGLALAADGNGAGSPLPPFRVEELKTPRTAPNFALPGSGGDIVRLSALKPRVVVINFWATWCIPCVAELPELKRLADTMRDEPFALLAVDVEEAPDKVMAFLLRKGIDLPVLYDQDGAVHRSYGVKGLPTTIIVDGRGRMVAQALGARQWHSPEALAYFRKLARAAAKR
jgi:thiol-disulfide isomerase/thioredoxin